MRRTVLLAFCMLAGLGAAAGGKGGHATLGSAPDVSHGTQGHGGGSGRHDPRLDPRSVPPLAPDRKVSEQDCSKPVDLTAGNLKCR